jgi:hypothetical protein
VIEWPTENGGKVVDAIKRAKGLKIMRAILNELFVDVSPSSEG